MKFSDVLMRANHPMSIAKPILGLTSLFSMLACSTPTAPNGAVSSSSASLDTLFAYQRTAWTSEADTIRCGTLLTHGRDLYFLDPFRGLIRHPHGTDQWISIPLPDSLLTLSDDMVGDSLGLWVPTNEMALLRYTFSSQNWERFDLPDSLLNIANNGDTVWMVGSARYNDRQDPKKPGCSIFNASGLYHGQYMVPYFCSDGTGRNMNNALLLDPVRKTWSYASGFGHTTYQDWVNGSLVTKESYLYGDFTFSQVYQDRLYYGTFGGGFWRWDGVKWESSGVNGNPSFMTSTWGSGGDPYYGRNGLSGTKRMVLWNGQLVTKGRGGVFAFDGQYVRRITNKNTLYAYDYEPDTSKPNGQDMISGVGVELNVYRDTLYSAGWWYDQARDLWVHMAPNWTERPYHLPTNMAIYHEAFIGDTMYTCWYKSGAGGVNGIFTYDLGLKPTGYEKLNSKLAQNPKYYWNYYHSSSSSAP